MNREHIEPTILRPMVERLAQHWAIHPADLQFVRNFTNLVYKTRLGGKSRFLRITSKRHRTEEHIRAELEFVHHVSRHGVNAALPVASERKSLLHSDTAEGNEYVACLFDEAPGVSFEQLPPAERPHTFVTAGSAMGRLHSTSSNVAPSIGQDRFHWKCDRWAQFRDAVPQNEREAWNLHDDLMAWVDSQPMVPEGFGMIHGDFTIMNLRFRGTAVSVFDFDACCRHWFAYEIASFLHFFAGAHPQARKNVYSSFMEGYSQYQAVTQEIRSQIPMFGKMRLLYSFLVFAQEWGFENLNDQQKAYFDLRRRLFHAPSVWSENGCE